MYKFGTLQRLVRLFCRKDSASTFFYLESQFLQDVPESLANAPIREPRSQESIAAQQRAKVFSFLSSFSFFMC